MAPILELKNIGFAAQNRTIVKEVSHIFAEGMATALVGPSGCGKSTILKLAAGILIPSAGAAEFRGKDILRLNRQENLDFRRQSAFVFQDSALWANQNLYQILELPLLIHYPRMSEAQRRDRIMQVVAEAGYKRDLTIRPAALSMGEQKLIAFARAQLCAPTLLFLDEWVESLDDKSAQNLARLVARRRNENGTVVFVSHDFRIIKGLADHIIMVMNGRISLKLTREQIMQDNDLARYVEQGIA